MRIALDAMGSDCAPHAELEGVSMALDEDRELKILLVGREDIIRKGIRGHESDRLEVVPAADVVGMSESPAEALKRKGNSSVAVCMDLLQQGKADAAVSAGNTGATMAFALSKVGAIPGVRRPTLGILFPTENRATLVLDVGANVDARPAQLLQFGYMGAVAASYLFRKANPRVGLLNIGHEDNKGNEVTLEAHALFKQSGLNFAGNVEGNAILNGDVDVVVCDGFVGNALLKYAEGLADVLNNLLANYLESKSDYRIRRWLARPVLSEFIGRMDYEEYGGALMLGVQGTVVVAHGRSTPRAIMNAIFSARRAAEDDLATHIARRFEKLEAEAS